MPVYLFGTPGPRPFAGHFRSPAAGAERAGGKMQRALPGDRLSWAGRLWPLATTELAWTAARAARAALEALAPGRTPEEVLTQAWLCLYGMEARWHRDRDLCVLFALPVEGGTLLSGCGLQQVFAAEQGQLCPILPDGHPLISPPGLPEGPVVAQVPQVGDFYALGDRSAMPRGRLSRACGIPLSYKIGE